MSILTDRFGNVVGFELFKNKDPQEAKRMLCGGEPVA